MRALDFWRTCLTIAGITQADAFELVFFRFGLAKTSLFENPATPVPDAVCNDIIRRLRSGEPSAYVAGKVNFAGVVVRVSPAVLIPRPETEELVLQLIATRKLNGKAVLDLCTGSGCLALALAKAFPKAAVKGSDISEEALALARCSARDNGLTRVEFTYGDFLASEKDQYDLVVSNPPYVPEGTPTFTAYEPALAVFSGSDGLDSYRRILGSLARVLKSGGLAVFEIEPGKEKELALIAATNGFAAPVFKKDLAGKIRFMWLTR